MKTQAPSARCWFTTDKLQTDYRPILNGIKAAGADGWFPHFADASQQAIADAHALGLKIAAWTVNDPAEMQRLTAQGLDAICTDRPDLMQP